jgi:hypothetical protein
MEKSRCGLTLGLARYPPQKTLDKQYTYMIKSVMLARQIILPDPPNKANSFAPILLPTLYPACPSVGGAWKGAHSANGRKNSETAILTTFRINTGSVDILPDEGMPQAIEVVGKTEQQGLANLYG